MTKEIIYEPTGNAERGKVQRYHNKPQPRVLNSGAYKKDVDKLKSIRLVNNWGGVDVYASTYSIGMEVEKTSLHRTSIKEYALFCGFETDASCGYEAVTNILPLLPPCYWRNKVFNMMSQAEKIIDDQFSPSDSTCGGHISLSVDGMTGWQVREKIKPLMGLMYAMFAKRLSNGYCNGNLRLTDESSCEWVNGDTWRGSWRYQVVQPKDDYMEIRLPSRFTSVKQMMRRYEICYLMLDCGIKGTNFKTFLKKADKILMMMYDQDRAKVEAIKEKAVHFQDFINKGNVHESIQGFVPPPRSN
jgi:hypothetical protein